MNTFTFLFGHSNGTAVAGERMDSAAASKATTGLGWDSRPLTAKGLIGTPVENERGETIAKVNDLLISTRSGRVFFVVLASGGFAGVGVRLRAVPPGTLSQATAKRGVLAMDVSPKQWKLAPRVNKEQLGDLENASVARNIYAYYEQPWLEPTGSVLPADPADLALHLKPASELIGESVVNAHDGEVGRIADLAVTLNDADTVKAIVEPSATDGRSFDIPVNKLSSNPSGNNLLLNLDKRELQQTHSSEPGVTMVKWLHNVATKS